MSKYLLPSHEKAKGLLFPPPVSHPCYVFPEMMCHTKTSYWKGRVRASWPAPAFSVAKMPEAHKRMAQRSNYHNATQRFTCSASCNVTELQIPELRVWRWLSENKTRKDYDLNARYRIMFEMETRTLGATGWAVVTGKHGTHPCPHGICSLRKAL